MENAPPPVVPRFVPTLTDVVRPEALAEAADAASFTGAPDARRAAAVAGDAPATLSTPLAAPAARIDPAAVAVPTTVIVIAEL